MQIYFFPPSSTGLFSDLVMSNTTGVLWEKGNTYLPPSTRVHSQVTYFPPSPGFTSGLHILRPYQGSPSGYIFSALTKVHPRVTYFPPSPGFTPGFFMGSVLLILLVFCVVFLILFVLCPIFSVSMDCPFLFAPLVISNVYLE